MTRRGSLRSRLIPVVFPFIVAAFLVYTVTQLLSGERGLFTWIDIRNQVEMLEQHNAVLELQKEALERQALRLQVATLDKDYVDESIRRSLPYLNPHDVVLFISGTSQ
ncbi:MAG: septum formation initiator family protein [Alphaproteobacteria bacterium]